MGKQRDVKLPTAFLPVKPRLVGYSGLAYSKRISNPPYGKSHNLAQPALHEIA